MKYKLYRLHKKQSELFKGIELKLWRNWLFSIISDFL